jgi:hypothetical protein
MRTKEKGNPRDRKKENRHRERTTKKEEMRIWRKKVRT